MNFQIQIKEFSFEEQKRNIENFEQKSWDYVTYGFKATLGRKNGKSVRDGMFYILEEDYNVLQWLIPTKEYIKSRLHLDEIKTINYDYQYVNKNKKLKDGSNLVLRGDTFEYCLSFQTVQERDMVHCGLQQQILYLNNLINAKGADQAQEMADKFFVHADKDGDKQISFEEFSKEFAKLHTSVVPRKLKQFYENYDEDGSGTIDQKELKHIFRDMIYKEQVLEIYLQYSEQAKDIYRRKMSIVYQQVRQMEQQMTKQNEKEVQRQINRLLEKKNIMKDYFKVMKISELLNFFKNEQAEIQDEKQVQNELNSLYKDNYYEEQWSDLNEKLKQVKQDQYQQLDGQIYNDQTKISLYQFHNILFSRKNTIFNPKKAEIFMNMELPLQDYYISSSHNTYLMENQLTGASDTQAYINAFQKGTRCVELDIWDDKKKNIPIITHGHTLTSDITFENVIKCIKEHAFQFSSYPLVLSFENHCSPPFQNQMAEILEREIGDMIYRVPKDAENYRCYQTLDKLQNKIIIKGKQSLITVLDMMYKDRDARRTIKTNIKSQKQLVDIDKMGLDDLVNLDDSAIEEVQHTQALSELHPLSKGLKDKTDGKLLNYDEDKKKEKEKEQEIECNGKLGKFITMFGGKFSIDDPNRTVWQISSLDENKLIKLQNKYQKQFISWHSKNFSRIYPSGLRVGSSNYDPFPGILSGSQIVALNFQTNDIPMLQYTGMFQMNGGVKSGFIPKPKWMRYGQKIKSSLDFTKVQQVIDVQVISGQFLRPFDYETNVTDVVDPYVQISVKGSSYDTNENNEQKTKVVDDNGFNPVWTQRLNEQIKDDMRFSIKCPDLAQLTINVFDKDIVGKEKLGQYSLPIKCLRPGFRMVPLLDQHFKVIENSTLFLHISIEKTQHYESYDDEEQIREQSAHKYYKYESRFNGNLDHVFDEVYSPQKSPNKKM